MRIMNDVTCKRCTWTTSCMWIDPRDVIATHACFDGGRSDSFYVTTRIVLGPGERGKDTNLIDEVEMRHDAILDEVGVP